MTLQAKKYLTKLLRALKECAASLRIHLKMPPKPASGEKLFGLNEDLKVPADLNPD